MATVRQTVKNAFRKAGSMPLGGSISAAQSNQGLELIQELYDTLVAEQTLGAFTEVFKEEDYEAKEGERVYRKTNTVDVTFPTTVTDDATGEERAPYDGAIIAAVGPNGALPDIRAYNANTAAWEPLTALTLNSSAPLTSSHKTDIEALLAALIADENGLPVGPVLAGEIRAAKYHLARRKSLRNRPAQGEYM